MDEPLIPGPTRALPDQPPGPDTPLPEPPQPFQKPDGLRWWTKAAIPIIAVGGVVIIFSLATPSHTMGSSLTYRLKCEERDRQIAAQIEESRQIQSDEHPTTAPASETR